MMKMKMIGGECLMTYRTLCDMMVEKETGKQKPLETIFHHLFAYRYVYVYACYCWVRISSRRNRRELCFLWSSEGGGRRMS